MKLPSREILIALFVLLVVAASAVGVGAYWYFTKPSQFRIAVGNHGSNEQVLIDAFASALRDSKSNISVQPVFYEDLHQAAEALQKGSAPFAVVRPDVELPNNGLTVAILREEALIIASPAARKIADVADLNGKRVALVDMRDPDRALLLRVLSSYDLTDKEVRFSQVTASDIPNLAKAKQIDAIAFIAAAVSSEAGQLIRNYARASGGEVNIVPVDEAEALSLRYPVFTKVTVPAGAFGGRPKKPSEELTTIGISYRLMAGSRVDRQPVSELTANLFRLRSRISSATATINLLQPPDTDSATSAALPVHPGAVDYLNREQLTFMDRWGDWLWLGLFAGGGVTSVLAWIGQLFARQKREAVDEVLEELANLLARARKSDTYEELAEVTLQLDEVVRQAIRFTRRGLTSTRVMSALMLAIDSTRAAIADRRSVIGDGAVAGDPMQPESAPAHFASRSGGAA
jgi:TRAP transporter TAXI family solute receptor